MRGVFSLYPFNFMSVGIDVSADFSWISILTPDHKPVVKPFKVLHNDLDSLERAVSTIKKAEECNSMKARTFLESTGIYHYPLFRYLKKSGFEVFILNPLITDSNKNSGIRKVKNDKSDSFRIAKTGYTHNLKVSLMPSDLIINVRSFVREYYYLVDNRTSYVNRLHKELRIVFPGYSKIFSNLIGKTSLKILEIYRTPKNIICAPKSEVVSLISTTSRKGLNYATNKYNALIKAATLANSFGVYLESTFDIIQMTIEFIKMFNEKINSIKDQIEDCIIKHHDDHFIKQIHLLHSINGIGFISAVTLMCEIGDFSAFKKPKQLFAYFGLDPSVNDSGNFKGTKTSMSKRGSRIARRALYSVALSSVSASNNPVLKKYYEKKKQSKANKVALGAVMHKICNIIFAVLRDNEPFVLKTPEEHCESYNKKLSLVA